MSVLSPRGGTYGDSLTKNRADGFHRRFRQRPAETDAKATSPESRARCNTCGHTHVDPETLKPYLFWNSQHYTRNLIDKTDLYELLSLCWEPGMKSSIHNHKGQNCWMAAPMGRLLVQNYKLLRRRSGGASLQHSANRPGDHHGG